MNKLLYSEGNTLLCGEQEGTNTNAVLRTGRGCWLSAVGCHHSLAGAKGTGGVTPASTAGACGFEGAASYWLSARGGKTWPEKVYGDGGFLEGLS